MQRIPNIGETIARIVSVDSTGMLLWETDWVRQKRIDWGPDDIESGVLWWGNADRRFVLGDEWAPLDSLEIT